MTSEPDQQGSSERLQVDPSDRWRGGVSIFAWGCAMASGLWAGDAVSFVCCLLIAALALITADPDYVPPYAFGLPNLPDGVPPVLSVSRQTHLIVAGGGAAVIVLAAALDVPPSMAIAVLLVVALVSWLRSAPVLLGHRHRRVLRKAIERYAPSVVMPYAGRSAGPWQVGMWEPLVVESGQRHIVVNLHGKYVSMLLEAEPIVGPVIQLGSRGTAELDTVLVPSIRAALYVQNARENDDFVAYDGLTHVWLNHGDSDKPANATPRHLQYDLLAVAGQAAIDRYDRAGIPAARAKTKIIGRPQTREIEPAPGPISDLTDKTVLYAPTWHGVDPTMEFSSLDQAGAIVERLIAAGATVLFRPHPLSYRWKDQRVLINQARLALKADREATGREHRFGAFVDTESSLADVINLSDALITDISAVASDYLASGKPYAMVANQSSDDFASRYPVAESAYVIDADLRNFDDVLEDLLDHDPLALARQERRRYVLGDLTGEHAAQRFAQLVRTLVGAS